MRFARQPFLAFICACLLCPSVCGQQYGHDEREHVKRMLSDVSADVKKHYYDSKLHGVDWEAKVRQARENIEKADSMNSGIAEIAAVLDSLHDSHTQFYPPSRRESHDYGFEVRMVGNRCLVLYVRPDGDAAKKGLKVGDEVLAVNGHPVNRRTIWRIRYMYGVLRTYPVLQLVIADGAGGHKSVEVVGTFEPSTEFRHRYMFEGINHWIRDWTAEEEVLKVRYFEKDDLLVIRLPAFEFPLDEADRAIARMRKHKAVVVDLRGNPGGFVMTVNRMLGGVFSDNVKIFDEVTRDRSKAVSATGQKNNAYAGRLIVLIDSDSASASEVFSRVVQLEKRGSVMGDHSSGMLMEAQFFEHEGYGAEISTANLIMKDGASVEHVGVEPDEVLLPSPEDLVLGRDPVLSKAADMLGVPLTPEQAGTAFPHPRFKAQ
jgi:C-terminal processing protease CtpA/Prc